MEESMQLDSRIKEILGEYNIPCTYVGKETATDIICKDILKNLYGREE